MLFRVSHVEAFRKFEQDEEVELSDLLALIRGELEPSAAMLAGTAFHKCLELADEGTISTLQTDGYEFSFDGDFEIELPSVRELRASKTYTVDGLPIAISGQVDAIEGQLVIDHKTTGRFDPERYLQGCQWRMYLDIFRAMQFRWLVFEIEEIAARFGSGVHAYAVTATHRLEQFSYPDLSADCQELVTRFARFVRALPEAWEAK